MSTLRMLTITSLYPNRAMPTHGVFVENRLRRIAATGRVDVRVIAPVAWFPFDNPVFGRYAAHARVPMSEERYGIPIEHPRFLVIPKVGLAWQPRAIYRTLFRQAATMKRAGYEPDLIDGHYVYPDGVAATMLARALGKPVVVTARGTDLIVQAQVPGIEPMVRASLRQMDRLITVSGELASRAEKLGMPKERIAFLRNGIDGAIFRPVDGRKWRGLAQGGSPVLLSVGRLTAHKGQEMTLHALRAHEAAHLLLAGEGEDERRLRALAESLGVGRRVHFLGVVPHEELPAVYCAADILVHASSREGWPNVLLESMACGTPVIAGRVGGIPEIMTAPEAGILVESLNPGAIAAAVGVMTKDPPDRGRVRSHALKFGWDETVASQIDLYQEVVRQAKGN